MTITLDEAKVVFAGLIDEPLLTVVAQQYVRRQAALEAVQNIPGWASWTETEALAWGDTNIGTPLTTARASLAAMSTLNLTTFKAAMSTLLNILDAMWTMLQALTKMVVVLRNDTWPNLQNGGSGGQAQKIR